LRADGDTRVGDGWYIDNVEIKEQDTITTAFPFSDDFENGLSNWSVSGSDWQEVIDDTGIPNNTFVTESPNGNFLPNENSSLTLLYPIDLASTNTPALSFWHKLYNSDCTTGYDYAYVEISEDGGISWDTPALAYNCVTYSTWGQIIVDLSNYKTVPIKIRFRLRADGDTRVGDGWDVDNVEIYDAVP
jgi:bacillopeptidase F